MFIKKLRGLLRLREDVRHDIDYLVTEIADLQAKQLTSRQDGREQSGAYRGPRPVVPIGFTGQTTRQIVVG